MKFKEALSKLKKSKEFKKFIEGHKEAYLCTAFFIIDFKGNQSTTQLNFQLNDERIASFLIGKEIKLKIEDLIIKKKIPKLKGNIKIDIDDIQSIAKKQIREKEIKGELSKIIAILSSDGKQQIWNVTCFLEALQILNIHVDANSGRILKSEKTALSDFFSKPVDYVG